jgi:hypothetical protein
MNLSDEIYEVKMKIADALDKKSALASSKVELEHQMTILNARVRTTDRSLLSNVEYKSICNTQVKTRAKIVQIQRQMQPISSELRRLYAYEDCLRVKSGLPLTFGEETA